MMEGSDNIDSLDLNANSGEYVCIAQHPAPWWYRLLSKVAPARGREIPEAQYPTRTVLRQFAIVLRYVYLQQFATSEQAGWQHSHPYRWMLAIGLWGSYTERRLAGDTRRKRAPYFYTMDDRDIHHVINPSPGHTSIFIGIGRARDGEHRDKKYFPFPAAGARTWQDHIKQKVARI